VSAGFFRLNLCVEAVPPTKGYTALSFVHSPSAFSPITNVFIPVLIVQLVIAAASINAIASASVITQLVDVDVDVEEDDVEEDVLVDVEEEDVLLDVEEEDVEEDVLVVVLDVGPPPGRLLNFTFL
jgi:hypothetical protein